MAINNDSRTDDERRFQVFVVFTDSFMSGWGQAPRRSLYALACPDHRTAEIVLDNGKRRSEMKRGRITGALPRTRPGDHLSVVGPSEAARWYKPGAFAVGE